MDHHPTSAVNVRLVSTDNPEVTVLAVEGPLTLNNFFDFQEKARQQSGAVLLVDVTEVPYIDSAALGAFVGIHVSRDKPGKKYALIGVNDRLEKMFELTGVGQFLVRYPTVEEAARALAAK